MAKLPRGTFNFLSLRKSKTQLRKEHFAARNAATAKQFDPRSDLQKTLDLQKKVPVLKQKSAARAAQAGVDIRRVTMMSKLFKGKVLIAIVLIVIGLFLFVF